MNPKVLWLVTARAGSRSVKDKNIRLLNDIPLLNYRIYSGLSISEKNDVWISTDSKTYAEIARSAGAYVPFIRPQELATDQASSMDVVMHAMEYCENNGHEYEMIGLLEPTSPFVYYKDLLNAVQLLDSNSKAEAVVACKETRPNTFFIQNEDLYLAELAQNFATRNKLGRQEFSKQITPSGGFYISKWDEFKRNKTFYTERTLAYALPDECVPEIDEPIEWDWAEFMVEKKIVNRSKIFKDEVINRS